MTIPRDLFDLATPDPVQPGEYFQCPFCDFRVHQNALYGPGPAYETEWRMIGLEHARDCRWIVSRGGQLETPAPQYDWHVNILAMGGWPRLPEIFLSVNAWKTPDGWQVYARRFGDDLPAALPEVDAPPLIALLEALDAA